MKPLLFIGACCAISLSFAQQAKHNPKAKIKSITTFTYETPQTGDAIDSGWRYKNTVTYNRDGKETGMYFYDHQKVVEAMLYTYDKSGNKVSTVHESGKEISHSDFSRNAGYNTVEKIWFGGHMMLHIIYNKTDDRDTMYTYDVAGKLTAKVIYHYDNNHHLLEEIRNKPGGEMDHRQVYTYDKWGNQLSEVRYSSTNVAQSSQRNTYDEYGNRLMQADSNTFYIGGFGVYQTKGDVHIRAFSYPLIDSRGNWLQEDALRDGVAVQTMRREIEYY